MTTSIFDRFYSVGVIPVVEIDAEKNAVPLAEALLAGGLPITEITLRTDAALEAIADGRFAEIARMAKAVGDIVKQIRGRE